MSKNDNIRIYAINYFMLKKYYNETTFLMLSILLISNYFEGEQLAKENQRKGKIRNASSTGADFLVAAFGISFQDFLVS